MEKTQVFLSSILLSVLCIVIINFDSADATGKVGSYGFCTQFPAFPECVGWRVEAISDNHWFCEYVYLKNICKNTPNPEKQISLRIQDYCCRYIGPELKEEQSDKSNQNTPSTQLVIPNESPESILPLIIWTDKDHYNYLDKVIVYGKFDFTNPTIIQNINQRNFAQTGLVSKEIFATDIKLNGGTILRNIPVSPEGWFSAYFFLNNSYKFSTQNNLLEVEYITTKEIPLGGPKTHAIYHFTTGEVTKKDNKFDLWVDSTQMPNKISYGISTDNPEKFIELMRHDLVSVRLTTPSGYVVPIEPTFSIQDLSTEYDEFIKYKQGTYQIQVTYGDNTSKKTFEYTLVD
jgi:hypothetical protein